MKRLCPRRNDDEDFFTAQPSSRLLQRRNDLGARSRHLSIVAARRTSISSNPRSSLEKIAVLGPRAGGSCLCWIDCAALVSSSAFSGVGDWRCLRLSIGFWNPDGVVLGPLASGAEPRSARRTKSLSLTDPENALDTDGPDIGIRLRPPRLDDHSSAVVVNEQRSGTRSTTQVIRLFKVHRATMATSSVRPTRMAN
jgi:hypothetical protein